MRAYYNEIEPFAADWLENLIGMKIIPPGDVDRRSIVDVQPSDLAGYDQCHFFAGIGGWAYALRLAGWPESEPVWTGSCPCQPFSFAGLREGADDKRHLWPYLDRLIFFASPLRCFGEQVAGKGGLGWLSGVQVDLEDNGYRIGAAPLPAGGFAAPHQRERLWWVADQLLAYPHGGNRGAEREFGQTRDEPGGKSGTGGLPHPSGEGRQGREPEVRRRAGPGQEGSATAQPGDAWSDFDILPFLDGKARRVESGTFPLAHGIPGRVGRLRGYGNAIVPQVAAAFIRAYMDEVGL